jgi:hypothetical protein
MFSGCYQAKQIFGYHRLVGFKKKKKKLMKPRMPEAPSSILRTTKTNK